MKILKLSAIALMAILAGSTLTACDDDDKDKPNPDDQPGDRQELSFNVSDIFTGGVPARVGDVDLLTDANGRITGMLDRIDGESVKFVRPEKNSADAADFDMIMIITDDNEHNDYKIRLNKKGFVEYCREIDSDGDVQEWNFEYTDFGCLSKLTRTEGGNEVYAIQYNADRNIVGVTETSADIGEGGTSEILYGENPIPNVGNIMLFDEMFGIDLDEMMYAYYAGLLGHATASLPVSRTYTGARPSEIETYTYEWTFNQEGLPTLLSTTETGQWGSLEAETYPFTW